MNHYVTALVHEMELQCSITRLDYRQSYSREYEWQFNFFPEDQYVGVEYCIAVEDCYGTVKRLFRYDDGLNQLWTPLRFIRFIRGAARLDTCTWWRYKAGQSEEIDSRELLQLIDCLETVE